MPHQFHDQHVQKITINDPYRTFFLLCARNNRLKLIQDQDVIKYTNLYTVNEGSKLASGVVTGGLTGLLAYNLAPRGGVVTGVLTLAAAFVGMRIGHSLARRSDVYRRHQEESAEILGKYSDLLNDNQVLSKLV